MDAADRNITVELQRDGRISNASSRPGQLTRRLSALSQARERRSHLGWRVNAAALTALEVLQRRSDPKDRATFEAFETAVAALI
jgi:hypothetical protein